MMVRGVWWGTATREIDRTAGEDRQTDRRGPIYLGDAVGGIRIYTAGCRSIPCSG